MTKRHDEVFDAVLSGVASTREKASAKERGGARFLKRGNAISDRLSGQSEEKTLQWVDPAACRMWDRHNRDYDLLTPDNCRDLIDGIKSQGRQEFPAIVREINDGGDARFEVICGARRHYAISWLRANNYPQFKYLVEVRDLSDEEAFRLADIENRDREDISDYERAVDYAQAVQLYYGGKQKAMAERLEVSEGWLSRYLTLAKLPDEIVGAFASVRDIKELHARILKPLLAKPSDREKLFVRAAALREHQQHARAGQGPILDASQVVQALKSTSNSPKRPKQKPHVYTSLDGKHEVAFRKTAKTHVLEFSADTPRKAMEEALAAFVKDRFG